VTTDTGSQPLYEVVARHAQAANAAGNVGLVVGATDLDAMRRIRAAVPEMWFLVPGIGAQGGDLAATLDAGLRSDGWGLLINVSRSVADAPDPRAEAERICTAMRAGRQAVLAQRRV
jgi:orotidine-5'-phosphate decarboxylase